MKNEGVHYYYCLFLSVTLQFVNDKFTLMPDDSDVKVIVFEATLYFLLLLV